MESHDDNIKFAGDYNMSEIILHNHANSGFTSEEEGVNIQKLVVEMNIYTLIININAFILMIV